MKRIASYVIEQGTVRMELERIPFTDTQNVYRVNLIGPQGLVSVYRSGLMECARYLLRLLDRSEEDEELEEATEAVPATA